jgi:hypothetical protein
MLCRTSQNFELAKKYCAKPRGATSKAVVRHVQEYRLLALELLKRKRRAFRSKAAILFSYGSIELTVVSSIAKENRSVDPERSITI